jgi:hypothetical protein
MMWPGNNSGDFLAYYITPLTSGRLARPVVPTRFQMGGRSRYSPTVHGGGRGSGPAKTRATIPLDIRCSFLLKRVFKQIVHTLERFLEEGVVLKQVVELIKGISSLSTLSILPYSSTRISSQRLIVRRSLGSIRQDFVGLEEISWNLAVVSSGANPPSLPPSFANLERFPSQQGVSNCL